MSLLGISSSVLQAFGSQLAQSGHKKFHHVQNEFQQVGQDLESGNLNKAQQDFTPLAKSISSAQLNPNSPIAQDLGVLAQALQSGNLATAQQAYATLRQDVQQPSSITQNRFHPIQSPQVNTQNSTATQVNSNSVQQLFNQIAAALQSGNFSSAHQAYSLLQQDLNQFATNGSFGSAGTGASSQTGSGNLNVVV